MNINIIKILKLSDKKLLELSKKNVLSLSLEEMKEVQLYFMKIKRNPTDVELETIAQTWSEHCKHKTLTGVIEYREKVQSSEFVVRSKGKDKAKEWTTKTYNNLLKETVFKATQELDKPWCISVFKDNAGIIEFDENYGIAFKVETHNHPSALEPYGGAATGIGGVIRDILGVGLGAKPLANTDVFCFGEPELPWSKLPKGILHPKRIAKGVVSGVRDYGNRMGIPTVNGAVYFDHGYVSNPLVYCGTCGIIPLDKCFKKVIPGDLVLVVGGRTGRDGIHGATFSSVELDQETDVSAVQIGNPIIEKKVLDTVLKARDLNLYRAITDCGAGGLSSAVGELGEDCGVRVELSNVPLKYAGLKPWEIWISEAQERMVLAVPQKNKEKILEIFASENVEAVFIGEFTDNKKLVIFYEGNVVADLEMAFLHDGVPKPTRLAVWDAETPASKKPNIIKSKNPGNDLKELLSSLNICSREWIIRQYDHEVQGQTVIKPLHGSSISISGPGDAAVIWPFTVMGSDNPPESPFQKGGQEDITSPFGKGGIKGDLHYRGIVLSCGINPEYGKIDPYWMAASAIDEALRNAVCVGGDIERMALLDNFCWGNPNRTEVLGGLVRAAKACYDISKVYEAPFISGKDSLNNEYSLGKKSYSIPPALLISAVGIVNDIRKTITMDLKEVGNLLYILGLTKNELGGSQYFKVKKMKGGNLPKLEPVSARRLMLALSKSIEQGLVCSCHDCSEGGLAVALAEMSFSGVKGIEIDLAKVPKLEALSDTETLFSESNSRFIAEVKPEHQKQFEVMMNGHAFACAGRVMGNKILNIMGSAGESIIRENISGLSNSWKKTLDW